VATRFRSILLVLTMLAVSLRAAPAPAQESPPAHEVTRSELLERLDALEKHLENQDFDIDRLQKKIDDVLWFDRVGDVAEIDKVYIPTVPNPHGEETYGIANERHPIKIWCYTFVPRNLDRNKKHPMLLFPHGGVHGDFNTYYTHVVRDLIAEGYVVVAPEYRGSTGYGRSIYEAIDYGGLEVDDVLAARNWAAEVFDFVDDKRVGILGWSHGGLIALMSVFDHPDAYAVAYAGVPVSDLVARMGYQTQGYRDLYSVDYHIGETAFENVDEYKRRSPAWNAEKLQTPLLIHTTTNDRDVNVLEVQHLIKSLQAAGKKFEYEVYEDFPGGHSMNRVDSPLARQSRRGVYAFLARYLKP
jgi:dipeptidyl aminopeptidase/acylaminoacyl peptidase